MSADVVVLPSLFEGLPLVVLEAGAMGIPVIGTSVDGTLEAIIHEKTGLLVEAENVGELKDAMKFFIKNSNKIGEFGRASKDFIVKNFDIRFQVQKTEDVYCHLMFKEA